MQGGAGRERTRPMIKPLGQPKSSREPRPMPGARLQVAPELAQSEATPRRNESWSEFHDEARDRLLSLRQDLERRLSTLTAEGRDTRSTMQRLHDMWQRAKEWMELARNQAKELRGTIAHVEQMVARLDASDEDYVRNQLLPYIQGLARSSREKFLIEPSPDVGVVMSPDFQLPGFTESDWDFFRKSEIEAGQRELQISAERADFDRRGDAVVGFDQAVDHFISGDPAATKPPVLQVEAEHEDAHAGELDAKAQESIKANQFLRDVSDLFQTNPEKAEAALRSIIDHPISIHGKEYQVAGVLCRGGVGIALHVFDARTSQEFVMKVTAPGKRSRMSVHKGGFGVRSQLLEVAALHRLTKRERSDKRQAGEAAPDFIPVSEMVDALQIFDRNNRDQVVTALVMEKVEGKMLFQLFEERSITPEQTSKIALGVIRAVQYMHERGVYHRDLKPPNVMVTDSGEVKLIDMGMALIPDMVEQQLERVASKSVTEVASMVSNESDSDDDTGAQVGPIQISLPDNRWVRAPNLPRPMEAPAVYALPEVGSAYGTPPYMPDCELSHEISEELTPKLVNPADPEAITKRLSEVAYRRDMYAVGRIIDRLARQLHAKAQTEADARLVDVLQWASSRVVNEYEYAVPGVDQVALGELVRIIENWEKDEIWRETQTPEAQDLMSTVNRHLFDKQARLKDLSSLYRYRASRPFEYNPRSITDEQLADSISPDSRYEDVALDDGNTFNLDDGSDPKINDRNTYAGD